MCGRYNIIPDAHAWADAMEIFGSILKGQLAATPPRYNVAPTQLVPIIVHDNGAPVVVEARWGFIPPWWNQPVPPTLTVNARAEEAPSKPMWRHAWRNQRCLIPASGWYEWAVLDTGEKKPMKVPHHLRRQDGKEIMFAGLWSLYQMAPDRPAIPTCAIVTLAACASVAEIHERMPVVMQPEHWLRWLDPALADAKEVSALVRQGATQHFLKEPVGTHVSNARNQGAECIRPVDWPELARQGIAGYDETALHHLRTQEPGEFIAWHRERFDIEDGEKPPALAELRLWIRELEARPDAEEFSAFIRDCRAVIASRIAKRKEMRDRPGTTKGLFDL